MNPETLDKISKLFKENDAQTSSLLFDLIADKPIPQSDIDDFRKLLALQKTIRLIDILGWEEHTSDWDPFWVIECQDGTIIETESGYWDFNLDFCTDDILINFEDNPELYEGEEYACNIWLSEIKSITLNR